MPRHCLASCLMNVTDEITLSADEYADVLHSRSVINESLLIEEAFGYVVDNLLELEATLHRRTVAGICSPASSWAEAMNDVHDISRRVINLLATCRAYVDSTKRRLRDLFGETHALTLQFDDELRETWDRRFEYRLADALRNHALHSSMPIGGVKSQGKVVAESSSSPLQVERTILLMLNDEITENRHVSGRVRREAEAKQDTTDVRALLNIYISLLGQVHLNLRERLKEEVEKATAVVAQALERYAQATRQEEIGIVLRKTGENEQDTRDHALGRQWSDRYHELVAKLAGVPSLETSCVTSRRTET
jgi:hypothetical protein